MATRDTADDDAWLEEQMDLAHPLPAGKRVAAGGLGGVQTADATPLMSGAATPLLQFDGSETPVLGGKGGGGDASSFAATLEADAMMMSFAPPRSSGVTPHPTS